MDVRSKHSFAIMAYKAAPFLEETVKSIISQSVGSAVYITTSTPSERINGIASAYNLPLYINTGKAGIVGDWEFALSYANTPYVTLVDQDDIYHNDYAKIVVDLLESRRDSLIAFTNYVEIDNNGNYRKSNWTVRIKSMLLWPYLFTNTLRGRLRKTILCLGDPICSPSVTYNLANLGGYHLFDDNFSMSLDWDAWLKMTEKKGSFCYCRKKMINHRIHGATQTSGGITGGKRYQEDLNIFMRMWPSWLAKILTKAYTGSYRTNK